MAVSMECTELLVQLLGVSRVWCLSISLHVTGRFLYISFGSLAVGISIALVCAYVLKRFNPANSNGHEDGVTYEISMVLMAAYLSYLVRTKALGAAQ